ncbi:winged helix-turn-helix transcriptional regulator [Rhodococcus pyridinivorans]|uniref:winged helix-turn-helix transcriptional regulator n=1 Tax=Rhodococcus pyridinivorans TaxID=103816 RepID=UPI00215B1A06|nr:helix-turn-helix domain-containing protein [Rhodococcus pyridinivorans]MCR8695135.1 helix-turn-helix transcriptional regulator [Rhodococcus pyridinivorans]WAL44468.1 helix-turn-helix transcriptional regulator [Rhodococcus pyridinivorans]
MSTDRLPEADVFARECPSRPVLQSITGRWGVLVLAALVDDTHRFSELRRRVDGVSERMLSQTLQTLERDGLIHRAVLGTIPPHVEYSLTALGRRITAPLLTLIDVVEESMPEIVVAQDEYDRSH